MDRNARGFFLEREGKKPVLLAGSACHGVFLRCVSCVSADFMLFLRFYFFLSDAMNASNTARSSSLSFSASGLRSPFSSHESYAPKLIL